MSKLSILCFLVGVISAMSQSYEDKRCQCICATPENVFNNTVSKDRCFFKDIIPASKCNCYGFIVPKLGDTIKGRENQYCQRCECKFERRNTTVIMLVVIMVLWLLTILTVYMMFLLSLDLLLNFNQQERQQAENDEETRTLLLDNDHEFED